jgi:hypothetical protein
MEPSEDSMRITSTASFLGLPLFELALGETGLGPNLKGPARAWIAVGDLAISPFLAVGGLAFGTVSFGGLALGGLALGGGACGVLGLGGCAIGAWAMGGLALGLQAAKGGFAASFGHALGGAAFGPHANTREAVDYFAKAPLWLVPPDRLFTLFLPFSLLPVLASRRRPDDRNTTPK